MKKCKDCLFAELIPLKKRNKINYAKCTNKKYLNSGRVTGVIYKSIYHERTLATCSGEFFVSNVVNRILFYLKRNG